LWKDGKEGRQAGRQVGLCSPVSCSFLGRKQSLKGVVENMMLIKEKVKEKLRLLGTPGSWDHITRQSGTHGYLGLTCKFENGETLPFLTSALCLHTELHGVVEQSPALLRDFLLTSL
jgi:hypothetical protein